MIDHREQFIEHAKIFHVSAFILVYILPLSAISIIYALLVRRLLSHNADHERSNHGAGVIQRAKLRAIHAMILDVVIFALCWLPAHIYCLWIFINYQYKEDHLSIVHSFFLSQRALNDLVIHLVVAHLWIQTLIYPRYSGQLAKAINETAVFLFSPLRLNVGRKVDANAVETDTATRVN